MDDEQIILYINRCGNVHTISKILSACNIQIDFINMMMKDQDVAMKEYQATFEHNDIEDLF